MKPDPIFDRYARQILLSEVGQAGQEKLRQAKILIIGAGGLGSSAAFYLAAAGVGHIGIADPDVVDISNLNRQILHTPSHIGKLKTKSATLTLNRFNPDTLITAHPISLISQEALGTLIPAYNLILDCSDNYETRYALNIACIKHQKPWVYGAVSEFEGQVMTLIPGRTPCFRCLYPDARALSVGPAAVMGVTPGLIGVLQATEALKFILNQGKLLIGRLFFIDLLEMRVDVMTTSANKKCPACSPQ
jgi:molybdopterin/thiamine biosynthesis adenylyltransferase